MRDDSPMAKDWLVSTGELAGLIRATDWSHTPLGPRERWPQSLRTVVGVVVESKVPMVLLWGPELILLYNDPCRSIYADRHPHALGRPAHEVWPEIWHVSEPVLSAAMERGEANFREDVPFSILRRGHVESACFTLGESPVRVEDGSIGGVLVTLQETTTAVERTRQLRESDTRFRVVIESSRDGINMLDLKTGKYVLMSSAQVALTGFSAEEINGFSAEEALARVHPDDRAISLEQQRRIAAGENPGGTPVEYRWMVKSGEYRWFSDSRMLVRDEQGQPIALVGVSRDITERKRAEDALRASEQKYAAIFENSPFALALSRMPDVAFVAVNDSFLRMFEYSRDEVIGKTSVDLVIADAASREQIRAELMARGSVRDFECTRTTKSGAQRSLSLNIDWVSIGGEPHVLTTIHDVTARKEAEDAKRLYEQTKALDELKTRFFSSISHELRTPLALIPAERHMMAADTPLAVRSDLAVVARNARTLLGLVDDLLDIARLEAGRMVAAYAEADLMHLVRLVADHFEVLSRDEQIAFAIEGPPRLPAQVDPEKVRRILLNLLSNAFKLTPAGGRVRITLRGTPERAYLEVADSGPGIPVERREAVFERFGRLDTGTARRLGGAGLGLSIARELTHLHGGAISISEAPEGGALFVVELPRAAPPGVVVRPADARFDLRVAARPAAAGSLAHGAADPLVAPVGKGPLVLVVEDNPDMSRFISEGLSDQYRVAVAFDGKQGLASATTLRPDLILCDLMMPEMGGEELVLAARRRPELDATPIVVLSAKADDEVRVRLLREGAQDYLTKPFAVEELRVRVSNLVAKKLAEQAMRHSEAKFRGIISIAADAIVSVDAQLAITEWNDGAERIFGYSRTEAIGAPLEMLLAERHRSAHREHIRRFAAERTHARRMDHGVAVGLRKGGEEFPLEASISRLDLDGEQIMTVAARDITDEQRSEAEQRLLADVGGVLASLDYDESLANLARITVEPLADFVVLCVADEGGRLRHAAAASRDPAKAWVAELMCQPVAPRPLHPIGRAFIERSASITEVGPERYEELADSPEHLRALHAAAPRSVMVLPRLAAGQCAGAMGFASASRQFDARDLQLAQEVARRCAMFVENARLHRVQRRATQARDEVLGVVAHDLRNPLNRIVLQAALLRGPIADPVRQCRDAADLIDRSAARMNRIIEDLLEVTHLEAGQLRLDRRRIAVASLVAAVIETQKEQVASRSLELRVHVAEGLPEIWADEHRMLQVFENLVGNAAKLTVRGSITIGAERREHEVVLWVADTGAGIEAEHLPHLFDRFWQPRDTKRGGVGLGLAIVKGIVEAHDGRVWVESQVGVGSTFFFTVPIAT